MHLEPFKEISWAFQLHYHICFRTHRRKTVFDDPSRTAALSEALTDLCKTNDLHLLEKDCQGTQVQLILSLRPSQLISAVLKTLKLVEANIDQLWQPSAYVGTCGELTTALLKAFLRGAAVG